MATLTNYPPLVAGVHWLIHNGGRSNNRHPGYPWKYMKLVKGEKLEDHWPVRLRELDRCYRGRSKYLPTRSPPDTFVEWFVCSPLQPYESLEPFLRFTTPVLVDDCL